jgi:regulator of replication initiation timing
MLDSVEPEELTKIKKVKTIDKKEPESILGYVSKKELEKTTQIANKKVEYVNKKIDNVNEELETIESRINNLVEQVTTLQIENKTLRKHRDNTIKANEKLKKESDKMKAKNTELTAEKEQLLKEKREITAQLREIPLVDVLRIIATQDKQDKSKWHTEAGTISITANCQKFNSFDNKDLHGNGAIDLVKVVFGFTFEQARTYLADNFGTSKTVATITKQAQQQAITAVSKPVKYSELPEPEHKNINNAVEYLIKRGLNIDTLRECYKQGLFFADKRNNAVFINETKTGAEIVGTTATRFKGFRGTKQDLWSFGTIKAGGLAVITESAIDALSAIAKGADYVISTAGAYSKQFLITKIKELSKAGMKIYTAFDNDKAGNDFTEEAKKDFTEIAGKVDFVSKDLNEELTTNGNTPLKLVDYQVFNFKQLSKIQQPQQLQEQQEQEQKTTICEKI